MGAEKYCSLLWAKMGPPPRARGFGGLKNPVIRDALLFSVNSFRSGDEPCKFL